MGKRGRNKIQRKEWWDELSERRKETFSLLLLALVPLALFSPSILGGMQYMGHDMIQWRAGAQSLIEARNALGEIAHWATHMFSGMPAATLSHPPQPWNLDTFLQLLQPIYPLVEYWVFLGGLYLFFRLMKFHRLSSLFGAIIIALSTYFPIIIGAGHNAKFLAVIYIPWLFAGYQLLMHTRWSRPLSFFIFALALTLHLRAFHPQVTYYFLFPLGIWFLYDLYTAWREERLQPLLKPALLLAAAAGLAALVSIQIYWSTLEFSPYSIRGGSEVAETTGLGEEYAFTWSQGRAELMTLIIPGAFGGAEAYWGPKPMTSGPHYFGAIAFLFFIIGLLKSPHHLKWIFFGAGALTLLFSLGSHFSGLNRLMFHHFPLFNKFRTPEMWLIVTVFTWGTVSVMGMEWIREQFRSLPTRKEWHKPAAAAGAIGLLAVFAVFALLSYEKPGERNELAAQVAQQNQVDPDDPRVANAVNRVLTSELIPAREEMAKGDAIRFILLLVGGIVLLGFAASGKLSVWLLMLVVSGAALFDLVTVNSRYMSEQALVDQTLTPEEVIRRQERPLDRAIQSEIDHEEGWPWRTFPLLDNPFNNAIPAYYYPSIGGYSGAKPGYYQDMIDHALYSGPHGVNLPLLRMLNVKFITIGSPVELPGWEVHYEGDDGVVLETTDPLPKAFYADRVHEETPPVQMLQALTGEFEPRSEAWIDGTLEQQPVADPEASVRISRYEPNLIELETRRSEPGFLVLSEIWYPPGWSAWLNGVEELPIHRTNYILRGVEIPAGEHRIELRLEPTWYQAGNLISRGANLLLIGIGIFGLWVGYRRGGEEDLDIG
ncbi:MAG: hypothetical protein WDZ29_01735 [Balneolaceae bacterium]